MRAPMPAPLLSYSPEVVKHSARSRVWSGRLCYVVGFIEDLGRRDRALGLVWKLLKLNMLVLCFGLRRCLRNVSRRPCRLLSLRSLTRRTTFHTSPSTSISQTHYPNNPLPLSFH